jgi:dienelactone hydrolase
MRNERGWIVFLVGLVVAGLAPSAVRLWRAQRLLRSLVAAPNAPPADVRTEEVLILGNRPPIRARLYYSQSGSRRQGLVVAHGVHYQGMDGRLVPFARALAESGLVVLTPALEDLADYRIDPRSVGQLADSVVYVGGRTDLVDGRVGLLGFSFGGGLALLAAAQPALHERLSHVVSIGGYHDLGRVLRFYLTGVADTPEGGVPGHPHEYGPLVLVYRHLDALVPARDRRPIREVVRAWLREEWDRARALAVRLSTAKARRLFALIDGRMLERLRPQLRRLLAADRDALAALSPHHRLAEIGAPVFLLHGQADTVIPASEARWAAAELGDHEHEELISPVLGHAEVRQAGLGDQLELVLFTAHAL